MGDWNKGDAIAQAQEYKVSDQISYLQKLHVLISHMQKSWHGSGTHLEAVTLVQEYRKCDGAVSISMHSLVNCDVCPLHWQLAHLCAQLCGECIPGCDQV